MVLTPYFQFGNIKAVESANYALSRGVSPSVCTISILPGAQLDRVPKTMTFGDGVRSVSFSQCVIVDCSPQIDGSGFESLTISIHDRRWKWRFGQVSGVYNVRRGGVLDKATAKTPKELAEICFKEMGEVKYDLSRMPNDTSPFVEWDLERPDAALDQLCQAVNAHVVLRSDDVAAIYPDGFGADLPKIPSSSSSEAFEFGVIPGKVTIATAPFAWQFDFGLEPVGLDVDGSVKPIQELSYKPKLTFGWYSAGFPVEFPGLPETVRELAVESVWRWFKLIPPKYVHLGFGKKMEVVSISQFLPLLENQLTYAKLSIEQKTKTPLERLLDTERARLPRQVYGIFYDESGTGRDNVEKFETDIKKHPKMIYGKSFTVDNDRGLVQFADPVYLHNPAKFTVRKGDPEVKQIFAPNIRLRCGSNFRDADTGGEYRFSKTVPIEGGLDSSVVAWEVREDITPEMRFDQSTKKMVDNFKDVEAQLDYYLKYAQQKYKPKTPASGSYPWLVPFSPDGRIAQVVYEIDGQGFIGTAVHRDIEGLLNITSYTEQRQEVARLATQQKLTRELTKQAPVSPGSLT